MTWLAVTLLAGLLPLLGAACLGAAVRGGGTEPAGERPGRGFRLAAAAMAGAVALHLLLTAADLAGLPWSRALVVVGPALLAVLITELARRRRSVAGPGFTLGPPPEQRLGWGDGLALAALAAFALFAASGWITNPDFVFHWGLKGERFHLARGVDHELLTRPWNVAIHPDYPHLWPGLHAASALLAGRFDGRAQMLWSAGLFALLLAAAREGLVRARVSRPALQAGMALVGLATSMFGVGQLMAGSPDWAIALAVVAALPALAAGPSSAADLRVGVVAAFAAASKTEGVPLAAFLVLVRLAQLARPATGGRPARLRWPGWASLGRLVLPVAAVVLPWAVQVYRYDLFPEFQSGPFEPSRAPAILAGIVESLASGPWHGLAWALVLLPALLLDRRTRPLAAVAALQLLFYLWVYFTIRVDVAVFVQSNVARLTFHLVPATLAGLVVLLDPRLRRSAAAGA